MASVKVNGFSEGLTVHFEFLEIGNEFLCEQSRQLHCLTEYDMVPEHGEGVPYVCQQVQVGGLEQDYCRFEQSALCKEETH